MTSYCIIYQTGRGPQQIFFVPEGTKVDMIAHAIMYGRSAVRSDLFLMINGRTNGDPLKSLTKNQGEWSFVDDRRVVLYGGTFGPPSGGHVLAAQWIREQGYGDREIPAIGHEGKPKSVETYFGRRDCAKDAFGDSCIFLEEELVSEVGLPIMAIDCLRLWHKKNPNPKCGKPLFAIGPDIDPTTWTGYEAIIAEGYGFLQVPHIDHPRSTIIRGLIEKGDPAWQKLVANEAVAERILRYGLFGAPKRPRTFG